MKVSDEISVTPISPESEGLTAVKVNDKYNYLNSDGNLLSEEDFLFASMFIGGRAVVQRKNGLWNYLKNDGTMLISDKDFEAVDCFVGPFGYVLVDGKWLKINKEGEMIA